MNIETEEVRMSKKRDFDDQEDLEPMTDARTDVKWGEDEEPTPEPEVRS